MRSNENERFYTRYNTHEYPKLSLLCGLLAILISAQPLYPANGPSVRDVQAQEETGGDSLSSLGDSLTSGEGYSPPDSSDYYNGDDDGLSQDEIEEDYFDQVDQQEDNEQETVDSGGGGGHGNSGFNGGGGTGGHNEGSGVDGFTVDGFTIDGNCIGGYCFDGYSFDGYSFDEIGDDGGLSDDEIEEDYFDQLEEQLEEDIEQETGDSGGGNGYSNKGGYDGSNDGGDNDGNSPISPGQLQCDLCGPYSDSGTGIDITYITNFDGSPFGGIRIPEGGTPPPTEEPSQPPFSLPPLLQWIKDHISVDTSGIPRQGQPVPEDDPSGTIIVGPCIGKGCGVELPHHPPLPARPSP